MQGKPAQMAEPQMGVVQHASEAQPAMDPYIGLKQQHTIAVVGIRDVPQVNKQIILNIGHTIAIFPQIPGMAPQKPPAASTATPAPLKHNAPHNAPQQRSRVHDTPARNMNTSGVANNPHTALNNPPDIGSAIFLPLQIVYSVWNI
jgi:hypothetical protein